MEIKFRAWDDEAKAYFLDWDRVPRMYPVVAIDFQLRTMELKLPDDYEDRDTINLDDCVLMQFTGLKDRNGIEIYEGDCFAWGIHRCEVVWDKDGFGARNQQGQIFSLHTIFPMGEIIGNIYEKPELLTSRVDRQ